MQFYNNSLKFKFYNNSLKDVLDDFAPLTTKQIQCRKTLSWYSPKLKDAKKLCPKLERLWKKSKLIVHKLAFQEKCAQFNKLLYKSKRLYLRAIINECNDIKKLHQLMNQLIKFRSFNHLPDHISSSNLSETFARFFHCKVVNIHQSLDNSLSSVNFEESAWFSGIKFNEFLPVSNTQVSSVLHSLNSTYFKLDPLPTTILKKCSLSVISAIASIINSSLSSAQVSFDLIQTIVSPLLKSPNPDVNILNNYRPISHLPFLSKILEKVATGQ